MLHSICQQIWKTQQWPQDWKSSVFIPIPKKGNAKEFSNYCTIALISHASKVMLKILQARLQQYVNCELPDVQAGFRKGRVKDYEHFDTKLLSMKIETTYTLPIVMLRLSHTAHFINTKHFHFLKNFSILRWKVLSWSFPLHILFIREGMYLFIGFKSFTFLLLNVYFYPAFFNWVIHLICYFIVTI